MPPKVSYTDCIPKKCDFGDYIMIKNTYSSTDKYPFCQTVNLKNLFFFSHIYWTRISGLSFHKKS